MRSRDRARGSAEIEEGEGLSERDSGNHSLDSGVFFSISFRPT